MSEKPTKRDIAAARMMARDIARLPLRIWDGEKASLYQPDRWWRRLLRRLGIRR